MQILILTEVKAAARRAYAERRLLAQVAHGLSRDDLAYSNRVYVCPIGAALTDETLAAIAEDGLLHSGLGDLIDFEHVSIPDEDIAAIRSIQEIHDEWFHAERERNVQRADELERKFKQLIGLNKESTHD